ncbi:MAG: hypothetical protein ACRD6R_05625 [Candidatus Polarisedimenticolia bacterium]
MGGRRFRGALAIVIPALMAVAGVGDAGAGAALVTVEGGVRFGPAGTLTIELGSPASGDFDRLEVQGGFEAGGTLVVALLPGFVGGAGDSYEIVTAAAVTGGFADTPPDVGDGVTLALRQDATSIRLVVAGPVNLSLDTFSPGQAGSRDAEVEASAAACP